MKLLRALAFGIAAFAVTDAPAATTVTVTQVPIARGTMRIIHYRPDIPLANLVALTGGDGAHRDIPADGGAPTEQLQRFLERGTSVILVDVPADMFAEGMPISYRVTPENAAELGAVLQAVQQRDNLPAWVLGFSNGAISAANFAIRAPRSVPFGLILLSPQTAGQPTNMLQLDLETVQRPTLLLTHANDPCPSTPPQNAALVMSRLSAAPVKRHRELTGGQPGAGGCDSEGYHGLGGLDVAFAEEVAGWERLHASLAQPSNYQGLWWRSPAGSEVGWGVNITHQSETLFATWFTYDTDGGGMWLVMDNGRRTAAGTYSGTLYRTTGPPYHSVPFLPSRVVATPVGSATFTFTDSGNGTFAYVVNGVSQSKPITRQVYGKLLPACLQGAPHLAAPNYQALWWASPPGVESGWGVNITHQDDTLFATWFTYDSNGRGAWVVMSNGVLAEPGTYTGELYVTRGPPFSAIPWVGPANLFPVGTGTFTFTTATRGTFTYTLEGTSQTKAITRQEFALPASVCR